MSEHTLSSSRPSQHTPPEIDEIEALLRAYRPNPSQRLYVQAAAADWMKPANFMTHRRTRMQTPIIRQKLLLRWMFVFVSTLLIFLVILFTPMGRSLAQSFTQFFQIAPSDHTTEVVSLTPYPTPDPEYPYNLYTLSIAQAEALAGFKVRELTNLPSNRWAFHGAKYESENQQVSLFYSLPSLDSTPDNPQEVTYLYVSEQRGEFEYSWGLCPNGTITEVKVNNWPAELSDGAVWVTTTPPTPGITREWGCQPVPSGSAMMLRWDEIDLKYEITVAQFAEDTSTWMNHQDLLNLAENMK